jgi:hypothetical protein
LCRSTGGFFFIGSFSELKFVVVVVTVAVGDAVDNVTMVADGDSVGLMVELIGGFVELYILTENKKNTK